MTTIDVAIPCFNYGRFLRASVESVFAQGVDARVLVIDNASTDDSVEVARQLAAENTRVEVLARKRNLGPHASYNEGIDWASSDYFLLLDADDVVPQGALRRATDCLIADPAIAFCHGVEALVASEGHICSADWNDARAPAAWRTCSGRAFVERFAARPENFIGATTVVRRTDVQKLAGYYRSSLPYTDDLELWLRLAQHGDVAETPAVQGIRRVHGRQATEHYRQRPVHDFRARLDAFESFFNGEGAGIAQDDALWNRIRISMAANAYWFGKWRMAEGDMANGEECIAFGLRLKPLWVAPRLAKSLLVGEIPGSSAWGCIGGVEPAR